MLRNSGKPNPFDEIAELEQRAKQPAAHAKQTSLDNLDAFSAAGLAPPPDPRPAPSRSIPPIVPIVSTPPGRRYSTASMPPDFAVMHSPTFGAPVQQFQQPLPYHQQQQQQQQWAMSQQVQPVAPQRSSLSMDAGSDMFAIFETAPVVGAASPFQSPTSAISPNSHYSSVSSVAKDDGWDVSAANVFDSSPQHRSPGRARSKSDSGALMSMGAAKPKAATSELAVVDEHELISTPTKQRAVTDDNMDANEAAGVPIVNLLAVVEGQLLTRVTMRTLFAKDWRQSFWIIEGNVLKIFKSKEDYQKNPQGNTAIRKIAIAPTLTIHPVKFKDYKGILHCFRMEEEGASIAKFASANRADVLALHSELERRVEFMRRPAHTRGRAATDSQISLEMLQSPSTLRNTAGVDFSRRAERWGSLS